MKHDIDMISTLIQRRFISTVSVVVTVVVVVDVAFIKKRRMRRHCEIGLIIISGFRLNETRADFYANRVFFGLC